MEAVAQSATEEAEAASSALAAERRAVAGVRAAMGALEERMALTLATSSERETAGSHMASDITPAGCFRLRSGA